MTETERLEDLIRAGEYVEPADLIAAGAADRYAELVAEGAATASTAAMATARQNQINSILDGVAAADEDPRLNELPGLIGPLLAELMDRANTRSTVINSASNRLRSLDAVGGNSRAADAWSGQLIDKRNPSSHRNFVTGSPLESVLGVLRELPADIRIGIRNAPAF